MTTKENIKKITEYMQNLELNETEVKVYLKLLEFGPSTITHLSKAGKIPRTTVFENVEKLIDKGLVSQTVKKSLRLVVAESPSKIKVLLLDRKIALENKHKRIQDLEKDLPKIINTIYSTIPRTDENIDVTIKFHEGKNNVKQIYTDMAKADKVYSFVNIDKYYDIYPKGEKLLYDALINNPKRQVWDIAVESPLAKRFVGRHSRYNIKLIQPTDGFSGFDILLFSDRVALVQLEFKNTTATVIVSKVLYNNLKGIHQLLWKHLGKNVI